MPNLKKQIIIFDLHGVLVTKDYTKILFSLMRKIYRIDILLILCKPSSISLFIKLLQSSRVPEEYFLTFAQRYHSFEKLLPFFIRLLNHQKPLDQSINLVKKLKNTGYRLYLFSNIGKKTLQDLQFLYPSLLQYFDGIIHTTQEDNWIQKPSKQAYYKFLKLTHQHAHNCLFIDNCKKNIATAHNLGFQVLHFSNSYQLDQDLKKNGYI